MSRKTAYISVIIMLLTAFLFYLFVFNLVIPKAAIISIPYTWRNVPLMQDSATVHAYLGDPTQQSKNKEISESWEKGIKSQKYQLNIQYSATSNLAIAYQINYHFKKWFIQKDYVLEVKDNRK